MDFMGVIGHTKAVMFKWVNDTMANALPPYRGHGGPGWYQLTQMFAHRED